MTHFSHTQLTRSAHAPTRSDGLNTSDTRHDRHYTTCVPAPHAVRDLGKAHGSAIASTAGPPARMAAPFSHSASWASNFGFGTLRDHKRGWGWGWGGGGVCTGRGGRVLGSQAQLHRESTHPSSCCREMSTACATCGDRTRPQLTVWSAWNVLHGAWSARRGGRGARPGQHLLETQVAALDGRVERVLHKLHGRAAAHRQPGVAVAKSGGHDASITQVLHICHRHFRLRLQHALGRKKGPLK